MEPPYRRSLPESLHRATRLHRNTNTGATKKGNSGIVTLEETEHFDKLPEKREQEVFREIRRAHGAESTRE